MALSTGLLLELKDKAKHSSLPRKGCAGCYLFNRMLKRRITGTYHEVSSQYLSLDVAKFSFGADRRKRD